MNVPGFRAELSIETSQRDFVGAVGKTAGAATSRLVPALGEKPPGCPCFPFAVCWHGRLIGQTCYCQPIGGRC